MPKYIVNGTTYNIPGDKVDSFEKRYPQAQIEYVNEGTTFQIPLEKRDRFLQKYPKATFEAPVAVEQPTESEEPIVPVQNNPAKNNFYDNVESDADVTPQPWRAPLVPSESDEQISNDQIPRFYDYSSYLKEEQPTAPDAEQLGERLEQANRVQVADLSSFIDKELSRRGKELDQSAHDRKNWWQDIPRGSGGAIHTFNSATSNGRMADMEYRNLTAARNSLTDAQRIIDEADAAQRDDRYHDWATTKFAKGAARGFGDKLFDARTWDLGLSNLSDNLAFSMALDAFDNGKELTPSQQAMLDAKAIELATNAYFGSYIGRGYKAGNVTAESIPFMLEMCLNPASATGSAATSRLSRYALKRFGKQTLERNAKKYAAAKIATRVAGDIAGSAAMAATTGSVRTMADAVDRTSGQAYYDTDENLNTIFDGHTEGDDFGTAVAKAFGATTIENYSEMVGEYFAPVLGIAGKGMGKGFEKIGLGKVNKFIDNVAVSDVGRLVSDFEKKAKWNGLIGEYAEEVAGGIMNALVVGDQTLDTDADTGVFNLDNNIDTFLGVSLMGGFLSSVKTVGYRTPKYQARKAMQKADNKAAVAFGDTETWDSIRGALEYEDGTQDVLHQVLTDADFNDDQKRAVLEYAYARGNYNGILKGEEKHRADENTDPAQTDAEQSFDNGYTLDSSQEMNDARNMLDFQREEMRRHFGLPEDADVDAYFGENPVERIIASRNMGAPEEETQRVIDYVNAKATYDGMITRVQDDIDGRISASDAMIDSRINPADGMVHPATLNVDDRKVYIVSGNLVMNADNTMIDREQSDESVVIRDAKTGKIEFSDPSAFLRVDESVEPAYEKQIAQEQIRDAYAQQAADKADGVLAFNAGDTYVLTDEQGVQHTAQMLLDNGDGTVQVVMDNSAEPIIIPKEQAQQMSEATNLIRLQQYVQQRAVERADVAEAEKEASRPMYALNDQITIRTSDGRSVRGTITQEADPDGMIEVHTEIPVKGEYVLNSFSREELDAMLVEHNGNVVETEQQAETVPSESTQQPIGETAPAMEMDAEPTSALSRIPTNEAGEQLFEQAPVEDSWAALVEMNEGDDAEAIDTAQQMAAAAQKELDKVLKQKARGGATVAEIQQNKAAQKAKIKQLQEKIAYWNGVAGFKAEQERLAAALAKAERRTKMAELQATLQQQGRYSKENAELGGYLDFRDYVMRAIATGGVKFKWSDNGNGTKGLGSHLGLKNSRSEMSRRIWMLNNESGEYPEVIAESLLSSYAESLGIDGYAEEATGMTTMDALGEILDVAASYDSPRELFAAAQSRHQPPQETDTNDNEARNEYELLKAEAEAMHMSIEDWEAYQQMMQEIILPELDKISDEELLSIFVNAYLQEDERSRENDEIQHRIPQGAERVARDSDGGTALPDDGTDNAGTDRSRQAIGPERTDVVAEQSPVDVPAADIPSTAEPAIEDGTGFNEDPTQKELSISQEITQAEQETDIAPTDAQKAAGNYKKGHVKIDGFDITIENPKGSERSGVDNAGNPWSVTMNNTYGYIRGTEGVDGDHIDVFLSDHLDDWTGMVFVVDQIKDDGSFDEHKVMYGFNTSEEAQEAYLKNFSDGWNGLGAITCTNKEDFQKWIASSHRKTKPFAEYKRINPTNARNGYSVERRFHKKNNTHIYALKFNEQMSREDFVALKSEVKKFGGYYSSYGKGGFIFDNEADADKFATTILGNALETVEEKRPLSLSDMVEVSNDAAALSEIDNIPSLEDEYEATYRKFTTGATLLAKMEVQNTGRKLADALNAKFRSEGKKLKERRDLIREHLRSIRHKVDAPIDAKLYDYGDVGSYSLVSEAIGKTFVRGKESIEFLSYDKENGKVIANLNTDFIGADNYALSVADAAAYIREEGWEVKSETTNPSGNKLVSDERYNELRERMRKKLGQLNIGVDPEILAIGTEMAVYHIEKGARKFADYAKAMIEDLGDVIRPYLKSFYNGARELPEMADAGLSTDMTAYDEVRTFDVANFDKDVPNAIGAAEVVVREQEINRQAEAAKELLSESKDEKTHDVYEQTTADTETFASEAEAIASEAESQSEIIEDEAAGNEIVARIDAQIKTINEQLALLGYYKADTDDENRFDEQFGYSKTAEKKAVSDADKLAKKIASDLGIPTSRKRIATANIAPAGGNITFRLPLTEGRSLLVSIDIGPDSYVEGHGYSDDLKVFSNYLRIEDQTASGQNQYISPNENFKSDVIYSDLIETIRRTIRKYVPDFVIKPAEAENLSTGNVYKPRKKSVAPQQMISDLFSGISEKELPASVEEQQIAIEETDAVHERGQSTSSDTAIRNARNNQNERGKDYAPASPKARFDANIAAIRIMRDLIDGAKAASEADMATLRRYSGWGGLGTYFNNENSAENKILHDLLSPEEYDAAVQSINSAYYTPASVIDTLWDAVEKLGFKGGKILEGSAGIGNIIGSMPRSISAMSDIEAVEIDTVSGNILKLLYPDAKVSVQGFEDTSIRNGSVDLAITNVPFVTGLHVFDKIDKDLSNKFGDIHDFCIAKNVRKLREGGLGVFITSSGTLDKSKKLREWLIDPKGGCADVIGAFRLNNETFGGTNVTSDIIIVKKRIGGRVSPQAIDVQSASFVREGLFETGQQEWDRKSVSWKNETKTAQMYFNDYFQQHPECMAGEMLFAYEKGETYRPGSIGLYPKKGMDQSSLLKSWVEQMQPIEESHDESIRKRSEAESTEVKEGQLLLNSKGEICISQRGEAVALDLNGNKVNGHTKSECLQAYNRLKIALDNVLQKQIDSSDDNVLQSFIDELNSAYDDFVNRFGRLNRNMAISFLRNDVEFPSIAAIEKYSEAKDMDGTTHVQTEKTNVFKGRVIGFQAEPQPKTIKDGVIASIYKRGYIDIEYISGKLSNDADAVKSAILSEGLGFENPISGAIEVRYEYLSGNVREKLDQARDNNEDGRFDANIKALEQVVPMDIPAHLIEFQIGSSWIDPSLYNYFFEETYGISMDAPILVNGTWVFSGHIGSERNDKNISTGVYSEKLHKRVYGHELAMAAMNNTPIVMQIKVQRSDGFGGTTTETITDKEATTICAQRIGEIKDEFREWARSKMQQDSGLSEHITDVYNKKFNAIVPKHVDEMFFPDYFGGAAHDISLYPHQKQAVIRATTEPLMLAHEVGTGKTFTLISTAMEMRRLGTAKKPMIVVQNATTGQFVNEAKRLYPNAKVLTIEPKDRTPEGRRAFYAKIKYNDWDLIIIPQSVFNQIPDSIERQLGFIQDRIDEKLYALDSIAGNDSDSSHVVKRNLEREIERLQDSMAEIASGEKRSGGKKKDAKRQAAAKENAAVRAKKQLDRKTDDVQNFDDLGVDALLVDEAHNYKRLGITTSISRVKGIDTAGSSAAAGLFLKTRTIFEKCGWKNVVFATGTPISNTAAEIWTFMKYLMPKDLMQANDIYHFDDFVRNFGNISQSLEFATNGQFKENTRFAAYINLPELIRLWASVSDTVLTKEVDYVNDKVPELEFGKHQDIFLEQTEGLIDIMRAVKAALAEYEKMSGKEKRANSHIPLVQFGIAKLAAIDPRLVNADAKDEPGSKTNRAINEITRTLDETEDYNGTIAIFCDNYRNQINGKEVFNLYEDMKQKLIASGIPGSQIVIMQPGMSDVKKTKIFTGVNSGEMRVIIGSTSTLGTGVNIQERLHTVIHMDAPNRPMDYTQRNGRILRQGNLHKQWDKTVRIIRFGVEDSLDVTAYQRLKTKSGFIDAVMDGKHLLANNQENRTLEEEEEGLFDNPVAALSGSQYALLKQQAEREARKYRNKKAQYEADQVYIHNTLRQHAGETNKALQQIGEHEVRLKKIREMFPDGKAQVITIEGRKCTTETEVDAALRELVNKPLNVRTEEARKDPRFDAETVNIHLSLDDMAVIAKVLITREAAYDNKFKAVRITMHKQISYSAPALDIFDEPVMGAYVGGILDVLSNEIISGKEDVEFIETLQRANERRAAEDAAMKDRVGRSFAFDQELRDAEAKVAEYTELMKAELAEKEAKYADRGTSESVDISRFSSDDVEADDIKYRLREEEPPVNTGIGYKVFVLKDGKLYPPMVANPNGEETPTGVWLNADAAPVVATSKTGRAQVKAGGKGTQGGSGKLAYRPGWHLGVIPYALQFNRLNPETGEKELFPANFVWAEVEYANDVDFQEEAMNYGYNANGKFQHSYAGLPRVPENGAYMYRTNPNPETDPWIITGAMKVNRILTPSEVDAIVTEAGREPQLRQEGAITDEQVRQLNRLIADRSENNPTAIAGRAKRLGSKLGVPIRIVEDVEELTDTNVSKQKRMRKAKGWFDTKHDEVIIVLPNAQNVADVLSTVLHEIVGHKGLRSLVGNKHFDDFLDKVFRGADKDTRSKIVALAKNNGWNFHLATEEYIAQLAEVGFESREDRGFWEKIRDFFMDMLRRAKIGIGAYISDNDLRYMLWRSYQMQISNGAMGEAENVEMQRKLGVGNYKGETLRYRESKSVPSSDVARQKYNDAVRSRNKSGSVKWCENIPYKLREAYQDSMLSLKALYDAILEETGNELHDFEDAYKAENRMSSSNKAQADIYLRDFYKPLQGEMLKLIKNGAGYNDIIRYLIAKHGLERNEVFSRRDVEDAGKVWNGTISRDFSGLTELTGEEDNFTDAAQAIVDEFEKQYDVGTLWEKINDATKETLRKSYESGLMSKTTYEKVRAMFAYYIPLRGWDANVAANEYDYMMSNRPMLLPALKTAHGRRSIADDPIATIGSMAESAIIQGNRNLMKQKFLNFVLNNPTSLATVNRQWYVQNAFGEWEPHNPIIPEEATADEVAAIVEQHEQDMLSLGDKATRHKEGLQLNMRASKREGQEHVVRVKRNGAEFLIFINGNPIAAQAVNGLTNPNASDSSLHKVAMTVKNFMARMFTSQNPAFIFTNLSRDVIWAGTAVAIKENKRYMAQYTKNVSGALLKAKLPVLISKLQKGTLDTNVDIERYFDEFIRNGGETGFTQLNTIDDYKRNMQRFLKEAQGSSVSVTSKAWRGLWDAVEFLNRSAEDTTRFMVFMTSRQMGRSISQSVWDAKEITINFNKKGRGGYGATFMNFAYIFCNATIQGLANFGRLMSRHPKKMTAALSTFTTAGLMAPMLALAVQAMCEGDDDDLMSYWDLPEWVRRNNIVIYVPWSKNGFITIPLPHELRPFYGLGELAFSCLMGKEKVDNAIAKGIEGFSGLLPLDYTGNAGNAAVNFTPTIAQPFAQIIANKDYFGKPIYRKSDYNELDPEWTKAYKGTNGFLVSGAKWLNDISGGDVVKKGAIDFNPAIVEHIFESYLGGVGKTVNRSIKTFSMLWDEDARDVRNIPVVSSFYQKSDARTAGSQLNREYFDAMDEYESMEHDFNGYKSKIKTGAMEYAEKLDNLMTSHIFDRYRTMKGYKGAIDKLQQALKFTDTTDREELETAIMELKAEMLDELRTSEQQSNK